MCHRPRQRQCTGTRYVTGSYFNPRLVRRVGQSYERNAAVRMCLETNIPVPVDACAKGTLKPDLRRSLCLKLFFTEATRVRQVGVSQDLFGNPLVAGAKPFLDAMGMIANKIALYCLRCGLK